MPRISLEQEVIEKKLKKAQQLISLADVLVVNIKEKERLYREALNQIRSAYNWSGRLQQIFKELHLLGAKIHDTFGCQIPFRDGQYWRECPVDLAHIPLGISIGGKTTEICSICRAEPLDCNHIKGNFYNNVICKKIDGYCNICFESKCNHIEGQSYDDTRAIGIVTSLELDEISIVKNPADPDACFTAVPYDNNVINQIMHSLNASFEWGNNLYCHHCRDCFIE